MVRYIELDALVAEIERLKAEVLQKKSQCKRSGLEKIMHQIGVYNKILSFLDTLEVKEVDIDQEILSEYNPIDGLPFEEFARIAKYFFEFGLKAQKGEKV